LVEVPAEVVVRLAEAPMVLGVVAVLLGWDRAAAS
jgi:hypothetical protein